MDIFSLNTIIGATFHADDFLVYLPAVFETMILYNLGSVRGVFCVIFAAKRCFSFALPKMALVDCFKHANHCQSDAIAAVCVILFYVHIEL